MNGSKDRSRSLQASILTMGMGNEEIQMVVVVKMMMRVYGQLVRTL